ncbi:hypothetical protein TRSC58_07212 [Trypanosoma rangeli SC58]|uniref:Uncharacterized protein n=1 Tax=Trypanosoma rangeli SC58 TaxID=429131 RepID=A0A061IVY1_TRYRA|nr:hypothetical protein TRSC58_07212 [Trypanosoma rangeli SC58]
MEKKKEKKKKKRNKLCLREHTHSCLCIVRDACYYISILRFLFSLKLEGERGGNTTRSGVPHLLVASLCVCV